MFYPPLPDKNTPHLTGKALAEKRMLNTMDWIRDLQSTLDHIFEITEIMAEEVQSMWDESHE